MALARWNVLITKCTKFGQLILRKIIKIVATRCQILRLKCIKFDFGWGSAPDPAGGAHSAPPDPLAGFKGPTSKGREGREMEWGEGGEGRCRGKGKGEREGGESVRLALILQFDHCPAPPSSWKGDEYTVQGGGGAPGKTRLQNDL